jgi:phospholipase/lecithinase/hemolysin
VTCVTLIHEFSQMPSDLASSAAALPAYTGVFTFGDSLIDPGNDLKAFNTLNSFPFVSLPNGAPTADKGYFEGRFTNGYNFADLVSNKLLHQATQPTFPYGVSNLLGFSIGSIGRPDGNNLSFAYGGAQASQDNPAPSLHTQIDSIYKAFTPDPNALYVISIGANDILSLVPTGGSPTTGDAANAKIAAVATEIAQDVGELLNRGARHVLVADVPDVGVTPAYAGAVDEATRRSLLTQYAQSLDNQIHSQIAALPLPAGATAQVYDFFGYTDRVVADPASFDFGNVTQALTSVQPTNPDPTGAGFLFFDKLHPTAQAHAQVASEILAQLAGVAPSWTPAPAIGAQAGAMLAQGASDTWSVSLTGGMTYVMDALGVSSGSGTLADPVLRVLDGSGVAVAEADDGGIGLDSHLQFTAPASGNYTVQVYGLGVTSGSFRLQAEEGAGTNLLTSGRLIGSNVTVQGTAANETLVAASGTNVLFGGDGNDSIQGGTGFDRINGNKGDDTIVGVSTTGDWLRGGQGEDSINAGQSTAHNIVNGDLGNDTIVGGAGGDTLRGGQADDVITGGSGADWISGDLGHNTLTGGGGADIFHTGGGIDRVTDFSVAQGDRVAVDAGVTMTGASQMGPDTVIAFSNGGQMTLAGVQESSLPGGWIITV